MGTLNLEIFTNAAYDLERAQYRVLAGLKQARRAFSRNRIYPHLGELVGLHRALKTILQRSDDLRDALPKRIERIDLEEEKIVYEEAAELARDEVAEVRALIDWALPHLKDAIEEGRAVFEFVDESLHFEEVGLVPSYLQEGYLLVTDHEAGALHILQYSVSIFTGPEERYRSLKTSHVKTLPHGGVHPSPRRIKLDLMEERRCELPTPATYFVDSEMVLPFEPTVAPVAKRKLMRWLHEA